MMQASLITINSKLLFISNLDAVQAGQNIARQRRIKEIADLKEQLAKMEKELESSDEKIVKKIKLGTQDDEDDEIFFSPTINELLSQNTSNFSQNWTPLKVQMRIDAANLQI